MAEVEKRFLVQIVGMVVRESREVKYFWGIENGSICVDCKDGVNTSKGEIGRWKLTEVKKQIFGGDYMCGCLRK